jgi:uncharacterized phage-associated protein
MRFVFNNRKAAQAGCWLVNRAGGTMNYMVLIKLLYLADRITLLHSGLPITGDRMVAMPHGPVLSRILDQINMGEPVEPDQPIAWYDYITEPTGYNVSSKVADLDADELSDYELDTLGTVFERYGGMNKWVLRDFTHTLPEWSDPNGSSFPIEPETILRAEGRSDAEIRQLTETAEELWFLNSLARIAHVGSR